MNHPKIGIGVLIFNEDNQLLLGERKNSHGACSWAPAGGHLEFGETFEQCAMREVKEETGLIIDNPVFVGLTNDIFVDENKHYVSLFFSALHPKNQPIINAEPEKIITWEWFSLNNLPSNLFLPLHNLIQLKGKSCLLHIVKK